MAYCLHCVHCVFGEYVDVVDESGGPTYLSYQCSISDEMAEAGALDYEKDCPHYVLNEAMIKACKGNYSYSRGTSPRPPTD